MMQARRAGLPEFAVMMPTKAARMPNIAANSKDKQFESGHQAISEIPPHRIYP